MMHPTEEELIDFLEQELVSESIQEHFDTCSSCQKTAQQIHWIFAQTKELAPTPSVSTETEQAILQMIYAPSLKQTSFGGWKLVAAALILVSTLGLLKISQSISLSHQEMAQNSDQTTSPENKNTPISKEDPSIPSPSNSSGSSSEESHKTEKNQPVDPVLEIPTKIEEDTSPDSKKPLIEKVVLSVEETILLTCGDMNQNHKLDAKDPVLLMHRLQKQKDIPLEEGDLNQDGKVNILDLQRLCFQLVNS